MDIAYNESNSGLKGLWRLDVYEGDIVRERLPLKQRIHNLIADVKWKLFQRSSCVV